MGEAVSGQLSAFFTSQLAPTALRRVMPWSSSQYIPTQSMGARVENVERTREMIANAMLSKTIFAFGLLLLLLLLAGCGRQPSNGNSIDALQQVNPDLLVERGQLRFIANANTGRQLAKSQGLPCLLFFTAEWCTFCHEMEMTAFADPAVSQLAKNFVCVLVDADREPEICQHFAIRGYPTVQFLATDGRRLHQLVGRQSTSNLIAGMQAALERLAWLESADHKLH